VFPLTANYAVAEIEVSVRLYSFLHFVIGRLIHKMLQFFG